MSAAYKKKWAEENKEKVKAQKKAWYEANKARLLEKSKKRYEEKKEEIKEKVKVYNKSEGAILKKIRRHYEEDAERGRQSDIDYDYCVDLLQQQNYLCNHCNIQVKMAWTDAYDKQQFSINRLDNISGHLKGNIEITCLQCNREYH